MPIRGKIRSTETSHVWMGSSCKREYSSCSFYMRFKSGAETRVEVPT